MIIVLVFFKNKRMCNLIYRSYGEPVVHLGPVASGRAVSCDEQLRQEFATAYGSRCFDVELDAVVESVYGNRKEQYMLIRGAADYRNGAANSAAAGAASSDSGRQWQLYSALMAAAVMRAIVEEMPEVEES